MRQESIHAYTYKFPETESSDLIKWQDEDDKHSSRLSELQPRI